MDTKTLIRPEDIQLGLEAADWEDALKKAAEPLIVHGHIEPAYVEDVIQAVKDLGPYIVLAPGFALGHARPSDAVHRACASLATLKTPVNFGSKQNDPVDVVMILAAVDNKLHVELLQKVVFFLNQKGSFDTLRSARSEQDARAIAEKINGKE